MVEAITNKIGKAPVTAVNFSDNDLRRPGGPASGRNQQMMLTVITKMAKSKSPGKTPAKNKRPMDCSVKIAKITKPVDGGIKIPKVPPAATTPVDKRGSYP